MIHVWSVYMSTAQVSCMWVIKVAVFFYSNFLPSSTYVYAIRGYKIFQFSSKNILQSIFFKSYLKVKTIINVNQWNIPRSNLNFPSSILNSGSYIMYNFIKILPKKQCPTKFNKWTITRKNYPNLKRGICSLINLLQQPSP